jgi:hypothetical protein
MGDISSSRAFSMTSDGPGLASAGVPEPGETPQSSRSGRLSSSSPAQSIWLPGVDGRGSMAKARTCSTSESMFVFVENDVTVGPAERCGGASFDADALGGPWGDDGLVRDFRAFIADASASTVKFSEDSVGTEDLF